MRIGHGFDVHKLVKNRKLVLGGVEIPFEKGLLGHSDADVLSHAVCDALLGATALGDIGKHFPDSDATYAGISSLLLLKQVSGLLDKKNFIIVNIDSTLILEKPKIAPYIPEMRNNIALAVGLEIEKISVKATTTEGLGYTGLGKGVAAHAIVLIDEKNGHGTV
jgi:2-C-methyl-D-erythritol 2,4-cyclodiphosphate synthase